MGQVNTELALSATATISLNDAAVRSLFGVASGAISMDNGHGKSNIPPGEQIYIAGPNTSTSTFWTCPAGVTSVSVLCVASGVGTGGNLAYRNNITVVPGNTYQVYVANNHQFTYFINTAQSLGGTYAGGSTSPIAGDGGGLGGNNATSWGGGGAGGYSGNGGNPGPMTQPGSAGLAGSGGGGGGGGKIYYDSNVEPDGTNDYAGAAPGGGVGLLGQGTNGAGGTYTWGGDYAGGTAYTGRSGSGGVDSSPYISFNVGTWVEYCTLYAGSYGGGITNIGAAGTHTAGGGAVRIVWPGTTRQFPSTNVGAT
jgi:hypothetical protein